MKIVLTLGVAALGFAANLAWAAADHSEVLCACVRVGTLA